MAETKPLISVIVPVYKAEKYLDKCVRSILAQTYENLEVILVDDGSPDRSGELCDGFAAEDPRVRVIHQENGGVSVARNAGLAVMTGQYFSFVDSDDYVDRKMVEMLYNAAIGNEADLTICGYKRVLLETETEVRIWPRSISGRENIAQHILEHYLEGQVSCPWGKLYRNIGLSNGTFDPKISFGEDTKFNIKYVEKIQTLTIISDCLYYYRDCVGSLSNTYKVGYFEGMCDLYANTIKYVENVLVDNMADISKVNYKLAIYSCSFMASNFSNSGWNARIEFIKRVCENPYVQQAVRDLPTLPLPHRIYARAIKHNRILLLYMLSVVKYNLVKSNNKRAKTKKKVDGNESKSN